VEIDEQYWRHPRLKFARESFEWPAGRVSGGIFRQEIDLNTWKKYFEMCPRSFVGKPTTYCLRRIKVFEDLEI
jgi:hypothetical protein